MDGRILRAMLVCFALYIGYVLLEARFFPGKPPPSSPSAPAPGFPALPAPAKPAAEASSPAAPAGGWEAVAGGTPQLSGAFELTGVPAPDAPRPRWRARLDERGGTVLEWTILAEGNPEMHRDGQVAGESGSGLSIGEISLLAGERTIGLGDVAWQGRRAAGGGTAFSLGLANGLVIEKTYVPGPTPDGVTLNLSFKNAGSAPTVFTPMLLAGGSLPRKDDRQDTPYVIEGVVLARRDDGTIRRVTAHLGSTGEGPQPFTEGSPLWAGLANKYFFVAARPLEGTEGIQAAWETFGTEPDKSDLGLWFRGPEIALGPGEARELSYEIVAFPKKTARAEAHTDLAPAIDLGVTRWIQAPLFAILRFFHGLTGNWGVAILLLTLLVKGVLHPLSVSQQSSMLRMSEKMRKLQPKLNEINERYKKDMRRRTEETMKLYKEHGNPQMAGLKGCLPMLLQMPVMIAMYWVIAEAVELRGAPFVLWMQDLSVPDRLLALPPWAQIHFFFIQIEDVNLLPILMTAASFLQMWTTPQPPATDPEQARQQKFTQYLMFGLMGFIFYNMASGLVLYWFLSTLLGIGESKLIKKRMTEAGLVAPAAS